MTDKEKLEITIKALKLICDNKLKPEDRRKFVKKYKVGHADADGISIAALKAIGEK